MIMTMSILLQAGAVVELPPPMPPDPEWNCENAREEDKVYWCAQENFQAADAAMNAQWKITAATMKKWDVNADLRDGRLGRFETLLRSQRAWIIFRDAHCANDGYDAHGYSLETLAFDSCRVRLTEERTQQLAELIKVNS